MSYCIGQDRDYAYVTMLASLVTAELITLTAEEKLDILRITGHVIV